MAGIKPSALKFIAVSQAGKVIICLSSYSEKVKKG